MINSITDNDDDWVLLVDSEQQDDDVIKPTSSSEISYDSDDALALKILDDTYRLDTPILTNRLLTTNVTVICEETNASTNQSLLVERVHSSDNCKFKGYKRFQGYIVLLLVWNFIALTFYVLLHGI
jgi:hypothetical protein